MSVHEEAGIGASTNNDLRFGIGHSVYRRSRHVMYQTQAAAAMSRFASVLRPPTSTHD